MQDGIHKNAPVPKDWKALVKVCESKGWKVKALQKFIRVITQYWKEIEPVMEQVKILLSNPQKDLFIYTKIDQIAFPQITCLQKNFQRALKRHLAHNEIQPIHKACISTICQRIENNLKNIDGHLVLNFPKDRVEMNNRLNQVVKSINLEQFVNERIEGKKPKSSTRPQPIKSNDAITNLC